MNLRPSRSISAAVFVGVLTALSVSTAHAQFSFVNIDYMFDDASLSVSDKTAFESTLAATVNWYETHVQSANPITVSVTFAATPGMGLGTSSTLYSSVGYSTFVSALTPTSSSAADSIAYSHLPSDLTFAGTSLITVSTPLLRSLGFAEGVLGAGEIDSTVSINTDEINFSRSGAQDPLKYDLMQVALHEMNEVLGFTSGLSSSYSPGDPAGLADLFRFSEGSRSFQNSDVGNDVYMSIDGGVSSLATFNQNSGGDFGDFAGLDPMVQDAFSTPGIQLDNGVAEITALDVIGYQVIPEPSTVALFLGISSLGLVGLRRRYRVARSRQLTAC